MPSITSFTTHQSDAGQPLPGCWKIEAGRALTLRPGASGVLRIADGRVWATMDDPHGHGDASGDLFLVPGRGLVVQAGQRIVLESYGAGSAEPAYFSWDPLARRQGVALDGATRPAARWQAGVAQPLRDLGLALGEAGAAAGRLVRGVVGLGASLLPLRASWQSRES